jgi:hypothetical protein
MAGYRPKRYQHGSIKDMHLHKDFDFDLRTIFSLETSVAESGYYGRLSGIPIRPRFQRKSAAIGVNTVLPIQG